MTVKSVIRKTLIRKQYSMGVGEWDSTLKDAKVEETKNGKSIVKLTFSDNNSDRQGLYNIPLVGRIMDCMIDSVFDDGDEDIYLEDMIGYKFKIRIERNGDFLNIVNIKLIDEENKEDEIDEPEYERENNLDDKLFKEDSYYDEEDDDIDFYLDEEDDEDFEYEDLPGLIIRNRGRR